MNAATFIVLCVVVAAVGLALRSIIKDKKSGNPCSSCGGGCGGCHGQCHTK